VSEKRLILANHNLNTQFDDPTIGVDILIPNFAELNNTNANTTGIGTATSMINHCTEEWGRPPNYLLVDYYNFGNFNGSALAAAAEANNVIYNVASCCGGGKSYLASQSGTTLVNVSHQWLWGAIIVTMLALS
jgi:hypothetical protein